MKTLVTIGTILFALANTHSAIANDEYYIDLTETYGTPSYLAASAEDDANVAIYDEAFVPEYDAIADMYQAFGAER